MSSNCPSLIRCCVIHEMRAEMIEMNGKLDRLFTTMQMIFERTCDGTQEKSSMVVEDKCNLASGTSLDNQSTIVIDEIDSIVASTPYFFGEDIIKEEIVDDEFSSDIKEPPTMQETIVQPEKEPVDIKFLAVTTETNDSEFTFSEQPNPKRMKINHQFTSPFEVSASGSNQDVIGNDNPSISYSNDRDVIDDDDDPTVLPSSERGFQRMSINYCKECMKDLSNCWQAHVVSKHIDGYGIICNLCGYGAKWQISQMKQHFIKEHPNVSTFNQSITDRRIMLKPDIKKIGAKIIISNSKKSIPQKKKSNDKNKSAYAVPDSNSIQNPSQSSSYYIFSQSQTRDDSQQRWFFGSKKIRSGGRTAIEPYSNVIADPSSI